jgi:hypothetical protein
LATVNGFLFGLSFSFGTVASQSLEIERDSELNFANLGHDFSHKLYFKGNCWPFLFLNIDTKILKTLSK